MEEHYRQIANVMIPVHENEEELTTLYIYDVDEETEQRLDELAWKYDKSGAVVDYSAADVEAAILEDLGISDDYNVMPGAPYHRFGVKYEYPHTVLVWDRYAYNV